VTFERQTEGQETRLEFILADISENLYADLKAGWVQWNWDNLAAIFIKPSNEARGKFAVELSPAIQYVKIVPRA